MVEIGVERRSCFGNAVFDRFLGHAYIAAPHTQCGQHLLLVAPTQAEEQKGVLIDLFTQDIMRGSHMLAGVG